MSDCVRKAHRIIPLTIMIAWILSCGSEPTTQAPTADSVTPQEVAETPVAEQTDDQPAPQLPPEEDDALSVVAGQITDTAGNPLADITVQLLRHTNVLIANFPQSGGIWDIAAAHETTTDADGAFALEDVTAGRWHIAVRTSERDLFTPSAPLSVARGWDQDDIAIRIPTSVDLIGQVENLDGNAIANAQIHFASRDTSGWIVHRASTDEGGEFTIPAIGIHRDSHMMAWAEGHEPVAERRWEAAALRGRELPAITLQEAAEVEGVVIGPDGRPVEGAEVFATSPLHAALVGFADGHSTITDSEGAYQLRGLPAGPIDLHARAGDLLPDSPVQTLGIAGDTMSDIVIAVRPAATLSGSISDHAGTPVPDAIVAIIEEEGFGFGPFDDRWARRLPGLERGSRQAITESDGSFTIEGLRTNERVDLVVLADAAPTARFRGLTTARSHSLALPEGMTVTGEVISMRDSSVISMAQVTAIDESTGATERVLSTASGRYQAHFLAAGTHTVRGIAPAHAAKSIEDIRTDYQTVRSGIDLLLPTGVTVGGNVRDLMSNFPLAEAEVSLLDESDDLIAFTDADGNYLLEHVGPGRHRLQAQAALHIDSSPLDIAITDLDLHGLNFLLEPAARIEGRVLETSGDPIPGATVGVRYSGRRWGRDRWNLRQTTTSDDEGFYAIEEVEPNVEVSVVAQHPNYAQASTDDIRVEAGATRAPVDLTMSVGGTLVVKVVDEAQRPIPEAEVRHAREANESGRRGFGNRGVMAVFFRGEEQATNMANTDRRGIAVFEHLMPGDYSVVAQTDEHPYEVITGVDVVEAEETDEILLTLRPGAVIEGRVVDSEGFPIAAADINLMRRDRERPMFDEGLSDEDGVFRFTGLDAQTFSITAQAEGYDRATVDVAAPSASAELILERAGGIAGHVFDAETDAAIVAFNLTATRQGRRWGGPGGPRGGSVEESFSDPAGAYEMNGLTAGTWDIVATVAGYAPMEIEDVEITNGVTTEGVNFAVPRGATITGRVVNSAAQPQPIAGVSVRVEGEGGGAPRFFGPGGPQPGGDEARGIAITDQDGQFSIPGVVEGEHRLNAESAGYLEAVASVTVEGLTDPEPVVITMRQGGSVIGRVISGIDNEPLAGAQVSLPREGFVEELARDLVRTGVTTGPDGRFEMPSVPTGNMPLIVEHSDFPDLMTDMILIEEGEETNVGDIEIAGGGTIVGYTFDADGNFLPSATVMVSGTNVFDVTRSDESGEFSFENLAQGEYRLTLYESGGPFSRETGSQISELAAVREGRETEVILSLLPGYTVSGTVRDEGTPVAEIQVRLTLENGSATGEGGNDTSDASGHYEIENLGPGQYSVAVTQRQGRRSVPLSRETVTVSSGDVTFDIDMPRATISGQVLNLQGEPINRADVSILRDTTPQDIVDLIESGMMGREATRTDSSGAYEFDRVQEGEITILVRRGSEGYAYATRDLTVGYGDALTGTNFTLDDAGRLMGQAVLASNGEVIPEFYATIANAQGTQVFGDDVEIDMAEEQYTVMGLAEGAHTITAYREGYAPVIAESFDIRRAEITDLDLAFEEGGTLEVTVENRQGEPLQGAMLDLFDPNTGIKVILSPATWSSGGDIPTISSGTDGVIRREHLPRGTWRFVVSCDGHTGDEFQLNVQSGNNAPETIRLDPLLTP